ncbi:HupE/UreJ family protein [Mesorhizobium sp. ZMM04-5]|uniref:HupE/UreJ family protein n=1 Tax=Mesorhizobium marinum TaxID=3228790 RepID=A0ABV3R2L5_9HYPH
MIRRLAATAALLAASAAPAMAHLDPAEHGSFLAGVSHPLFGADHVLAMVAVGLWAALLSRAAGGRALWLVPGAFVAAMALGFAAAIAGMALPTVEPIILASVVIVGLLAAAALDMPAGPAMALVGSFAIFHGHAHGGELGGAGALAFGAGFAVATTALHAAGIALALGTARFFNEDVGSAATRLAGGATALGGLWLAFGA